jgi:CDGSH-type Zn-finger protein
MKLNYISLTVPLGPSRKSPNIRRDPSIHLTGASHKGSLYNVLVHWEDGSKTFEPLSVMVKEDPITCAKYTKGSDPLDKPGWKSLKHIGSRTVKFAQAKLHTSNHALQIDKDNDNQLWKLFIGIEMDQIHEYETFCNMGRGVNKPPCDHQHIRVHFVFYVRHDLCHKARLVTGGHMTAPPKDSIFSGVVTLRSLRLCMFLGELLNGVDVDAADVGNAYLMACYTKEKLYIIAGPKFGDH